MTTVLLTVEGPGRSAEAALPGDLPIGDLLSTLIALTAAPDAPGATDPRWELLDGDDRLLERGRSLRAQGISDDATLTLRGPKATPSPPASVAPRPTPAVATRPEQSSGLLDRLARRRGAPTDELDAALAAPQLHVAVTVAIVSDAPAVGRTTVTALLASLFAHARNDRAIAVDATASRPRLGPLLEPTHALYVDDLIGLLDGPPLRSSQVDAHLGRGGDGVLVLPAPPEPRRLEAIEPSGYRRVLSRLAADPGTIFVDTSAGLDSDANTAVLEAADQVVLVTDAEGVRKRSTIAAAQRLKEAELPFLIVVDGLPRRGVELDPERLRSLYPDAFDAATIRRDDRAATRLEARELQWSSASGPWRSDLRELGAALVSHWAELGLADPRARRASRSR